MKKAIYSDKVAYSVVKLLRDKVAYYLFKICVGENICFNSNAQDITNSDRNLSHL